MGQRRTYIRSSLTSLPCSSQEIEILSPRKLKNFPVLFEALRARMGNIRIDTPAVLPRLAHLLEKNARTKEAQEDALRAQGKFLITAALAFDTVSFSRSHS